MKKSRARMVFLCAALALSAPWCCAKWTYMIYMNATAPPIDCVALRDIADMANSMSDGQQIFVEMGRQGSVCGRGQWGDGIYRFQITAGKVPTPRRAQKIAEDVSTLGDGATVADFVSWATDQTPGNHTALILWGHGSGLSFPPLEILKSLTRKDAAPSPKIETSGIGMFDRTPGVRIPLHIRDLADALAANKVKLDVIGIEACLMGAAENAYGLRKVADYLVASESEIMVGAWSYSQVLQTATPSSAPKDVSDSIAEASEVFLANFDHTSTFAALDLAYMKEVDRLIGDLAKSLRAELDGPVGFWAVEKIRSKLKTFAIQGGEDSTVDLRLLAETARHQFGVSGATRRAAAALGQALAPVKIKGKGFVINSYPSADETDPRPNHGVSIFFPESVAQFKQFQKKDGMQSYDPGDCGKKQFEIEFVCQPEMEWSKFIRKYVDLLCKKTACTGAGS